jgi:hypothetical protein
MDDVNTYMIRRQPEPGYRWYVRDAGSGAVLGWFDYQVACWFAADQRQARREVEVGYGWRSLRQPRRARLAGRQPRAEPEAGA